VLLLFFSRRGSRPKSARLNDTMDSTTAVVAALCVSWYASSSLFNVGMKQSYMLVPDALALTTLQLALGALVTAPALLVLDPSGLHALIKHHRGALVVSAALFLGGTHCTNVSLTLLPISFAQVVKTTEPLFAVCLVFCWRGEQPKYLSVVALLCIIIGVVLAASRQIHSTRLETFSSY